MSLQSYYDRFDAAKRALSIANKLGQPHRGKAMALLNKHRSRLKHAQSGTTPPRRYEADFELHIDGYFTVGVVVTHYAPYSPASLYEPPQLPEAEFMLVDRRGYRMQWLEDRLTDEQYLDVESACIAKKINGEAAITDDGTQLLNFWSRT